MVDGGGGVTITTRVISDTPDGQVIEETDTGYRSIRFEPKAGTPAANELSLRDKASQAVQANNTFLGIASPTNAQVVAQVQRLTRENTALIKLVLGAIDDTAGT